MFDEPTSNYEPQYTAPKVPPKPDLEVPEPEPLPESRRGGRPFAVNLASYMVSFLAVSRLCFSTTNLDNVQITLQLLSVGVYVIILVGLFSMRRWGAVCFIGLGAWMIIHTLLLNGAQISVVDNVVENQSERMAVIVSAIIQIVVGIGIYGGLSIYLWRNLKIFKSNPDNILRFGYVPFILMFGVLILHTATLLPDAEANLRFVLDNNDSGIFPF